MYNFLRKRYFEVVSGSHFLITSLPLRELLGMVEPSRNDLFDRAVKNDFIFGWVSYSSSSGFSPYYFYSLDGEFCEGGVLRRRCIKYVVLVHCDSVFVYGDNYFLCFKEDQV